MASTYDIAQNTPSTRHVRPVHRVYAIMRNYSRQAADLLQLHCQPATRECLFGALSSTITTTYTTKHEKRSANRKNSQGDFFPDHSDNPQTTSLKEGISSFILDPPVALMFVCCLLLGCCVSSFCFRRRDHDRFQNLIFILALTGVTVSGIFVGVNPNVIMLGFIPWTCCFSMVSSLAVHWVVRRCNRGANSFICQFDEKATFVHQETMAP